MVNYEMPHNQPEYFFSLKYSFLKTFSHLSFFVYQKQNIRLFWSTPPSLEYTTDQYMRQHDTNTNSFPI